MKIRPACPWRIVALAVVLGVVAGCGPQAAKTASVSGMVTYNGQPIKAGTVSFIPPDGITCQGDIQPDGSYRVDNVTVGDCQIVVNAPPQDDAVRHKRIKEEPGSPIPPPPKPPFPAKYADIALSDLRYTVVVGDNKFNVEMK